MLPLQMKENYCGLINLQMMGVVICASKTIYPNKRNLAII